MLSIYQNVIILKYKSVDVNMKDNMGRPFLGVLKTSFI